MRQGSNLTRLEDAVGVAVLGFGEAADENGVETRVGRPHGSELLGIAVGLEPAESLCPERDHMMAAPEAGKQLGQERPESFLDRLRIGLVAWRLERNGVGQKRVFQRVLEFGLGVFTLGLVAPLLGV